MSKVGEIDDLLLTEEAIVFNGEDIDDLDLLPSWCLKYIAQFFNEEDQ